MDELRLAPNDHVLINALAAIFVSHVRPGPHEDMMIEIVRDAVKKANRQHLYVGPLVAAVEDFLNSSQAGLGANHAEYAVRVRLVAVLSWRAGHALDALRGAAA
ncbi:hypothetical protein [Palleronia pelagia]|uniref:Uncharacterized protein n=1 Tax=Palleronia pelagia TaxID=387096 RepID=A0A1H8HY03_9RHOB|nr:hypothetical protein [Palleronia pelagia]SEN60825.1 hypothetical protein SAMN04488011_10535 [Palleronia pelagia]